MPSTGSRNFSASYDLTTKITSTVVCVLLLGLAVTIKMVLVAALAAITIGLSYAYSPQGYAVSERCIIVRRLIGNIRIPLDGLRELRVTAGDDFQGCIRLWGVGGLFGYFGLYRTSKLGRCTWYLTSRTNAVVLITGSQTVLFSPDDMDGFLGAIRTTAPVPETGGPAPHFQQLETPARSLSLGVWIGVPILIAVLAILGFAFLYSPGPPRLTLTADALTIHDRFYPVTLKAADVDVAHIQVVDITNDPAWRPTLRTNGFANAHYRSGWFRVANGQNARMFWSDGRRLVLLPPHGAGSAVLVEVAEPDKFIEEVRRDWARRS